jgi:hypothetical protein
LWRLWWGRHGSLSCLGQGFGQVPVVEFASHDRGAFFWHVSGTRAGWTPEGIPAFTGL